MFLEQDYLRSDLAGNPPKLPTPKVGESPAEALRRVQWRSDETDLAVNREILAALFRSDIEVKGDCNPKIFHQKFILRDDDGTATPTSALLSGPANFTWTDTHSNRNNVVVFGNAAVGRQDQAEVEQLERGSFGRGLHGEVPRPMTLPGCRCGCCSPPTTPPSWRS